MLRALRAGVSAQNICIRSKRTFTCAAKSSDENKGFQIKQSNRRNPPVSSDGPSNNLINSLSELSKGQGMAPKKKTVFGADQMSWQEVDAAVNEYPGERTFTAVGETSESFKQAMITVVEVVLSTKVGSEAIFVRPSSSGKYCSIKIGPVTVHNPDQVVEIFKNMKADTRLKWYI